MVKVTYALKSEDEKKLISYASRYRSIRTSIDEIKHTMTVWTTWLKNDEPSSIADEFQLEVVSTDPPKMPEGEHRRRVKGEPV
jgi:hypothetical protein